MNEEGELPKLRMAPKETPEELAQRVEREQRAQNVQREAELESSLAPFRVGSVPYLNAVPLIRGLEEEVIVATPSKLATMLQADELDAALVSITEVLFNDRYDVLDGIAVASLGEVKSVFLAHRRPISDIEEIFLDPASLTSVNLLKVLLAKKGLQPNLKPLSDYHEAHLKDAVLLIGNPAIDFLRCGHPHQIWDLGGAWYELTGLPFVFAVWALRQGIENAPLKRQLYEAKHFGMDTLDHIINSRTDYDREFRKDYLGWHIHYYLGTDEKRGIAKFTEMLREVQADEVHLPRYVT